MHCFGVAVLCVLNEKHHQKRNDGCASINNELPGVGKMKGRAGHAPYDNDKNGRDKRPGAAENDRCAPGEDTKCVRYDAKKIAFRLVLFYFFNLDFSHNVILTFARCLGRARMEAVDLTLESLEVDFR